MTRLTTVSVDSLYSCCLLDQCCPLSMKEQEMRERALRMRVVLAVFQFFVFFSLLLSSRRPSVPSQSERQSIFLFSPNRRNHSRYNSALSLHVSSERAIMEVLIVMDGTSIAQPRAICFFRLQSYAYREMCGAYFYSCTTNYYEQFLGGLRGEERRRLCSHE